MSHPLPQAPAARRFRQFRAVSALMMREMESKYGRSPGGYIWALLSPIATVALLAFVFSLALRAPGLGTNFPLFYATGYLAYQGFTSVSNAVSGAISYSKPLLAYPAVSYIDALAARFALNALTWLLVTAIVLSGIVVIWDLNLGYDWAAVLLAVAMVLALAVGVGVLNAYLYLALPVWKQAYPILMRPGFILSGIFFTPEMVPAQAREVLMWYPPIHLTSQMREGFYSTYDAVHVDPLYIFSIAIGATFFGLLLLFRSYKDLMLA